MTIKRQIDGIYVTTNRAKRSS